jgi:class 3 adenylate cyclase
MNAGHVDGALLPAGRVTLLFSDIERSTRLLERLGAEYAELLHEHHRIVRAAVAQHRGHEIRTAGDAFFVAFARAADAVRAAVAIQRGLGAQAWPGAATVRVRIGLHTGEPRVTGDDYVGIDVHRAARICAAAHGGQIIVSDATRRLLSGETFEGMRLRDLGVHRLKDLSRPLRLFDLRDAAHRTERVHLRTIGPRDHLRPRLVSGFERSDRSAWLVSGSCAGGAFSAGGAAGRARSSS